MGDAADAAPTHVIGHVFLGSKTHARDREQLRRLRITHILNVTPTKKLDPAAGVPNFFEKDMIFEYRRCPLFDNKAEDISGTLEGCVAFIDRAKFYGRVLVHCSKGVSRSVSMVIAYLIKIHEMTYVDALALVQSKRGIAQPNPSFEKQLIAFSERMERLCKRKGKDNIGNAPPTVAGPTTQPSASVMSIGPQLLPHLMMDHDGAGDATGSEHGSSATLENEELEDLTVSIGPTLPPGLSKRKLGDQRDDLEEGTDRKKRAHGAIGPARAPQADS